MELADWKNSGNYFKFKNYNIFYKIEGEGKTDILCIHGFPTSSWDWNPIWKILKSRFRMITMDMIGFGFSDKPKDFPYSIHSQADIFEALLKHLNIPAIHIFCHDYGVSVTQELMARFSDRVEKEIEGVKILSVVFLNGGLFPETHRARFIQKLLLSPIGFLISRFLTKKSFSKSFSEVFGKNKPSSKELNEFWELIQLKNGHLLAHKHIGYIRERKIYRERWVGILLNTEIPIRLINGPCDPISGIHMVEKYKQYISHPDIVVLGPEIGHYPQVEDPEGVLKAYLEFMDHILR